MAYSVKGNRIYDGDHPIQIFGVNVIGMELNDAVIGGMWTNLSITQFLQMIKDQGFNTLRLPIGPKVLQNAAVDQGTAGIWQGSQNEAAGLAGKGALDILDILVREMDAMGMRYIFDWHYLEDGKIPDLWYTAKYSENQWLEDLAKLAGRYKKSRGYIGIDLKNEPGDKTANWGKGDKNDWRLAVGKASTAILAANPDLLIIVEPINAMPGIKLLADNPPKVPADKLVYSPHVYGPDVWSDFGEGFKDKTFPANMPAVWDKMFGDVAKTSAVFVGEFGGKYGKGNSKDKAWQDAFVKYLAARGIRDFAYWGWGDNSGGDTGGILAGGDWREVRKDKMQLLNLLWTDDARFSNEAVEIEIDPEPEPEPTPTPSPIPDPVPGPVNPSQKFAAGDKVRHKSGEGPVCLVEGYDATGRLLLNFWSEAKGEFEGHGYVKDSNFELVR